MENLEERVQTTSKNVVNEIKSTIYDWIAAAIIIAIIAASLNAIGLVQFDPDNPWRDFLNFLMEWLPYFMAAILLNSDLYKKGVFKGKQNSNYISTLSVYSNVVNTLTGEQIRNLYPFVEKYNQDALIRIQEQILKKEGLTYEDFTKEFVKDGVTYGPLISMPREQLKSLLTKEQYKAVLRAKKSKIKGLSVNQLLSSINVKDPTNIGLNEEDLSKKQSIRSTLRYIISTFVMSLIAIRDIQTWGWSAAIIVTFKVLYVFAKCYMSYFHGYNDITIRLASHIGRKTDVLKMYLNISAEQLNEIINIM